MPKLSDLNKIVNGAVADAYMKMLEANQGNTQQPTTTTTPAANTPTTTTDSNTSNTTTSNTAGSTSSTSDTSNTTTWNSGVDPFVTQYRDALERQRDLSNQNNDNARRNAFASLMGNANTAGMMYSNFPERSKIQYDTQTYLPSQINIHNTYKTGLDKLRTNTVSLSNQLADINDAIADLNKTYKDAIKTSAKNKSTDSRYQMYDFGNGYKIYGTSGNEAIYVGPNNEELSAGEFLEATRGNVNWDNWNGIWDSRIKTNGVGSDTVNDYYENKSDAAKRRQKYNYLYPQK